jgi:hypothetical protein
MENNSSDIVSNFSVGVRVDVINEVGVTSPGVNFIEVGSGCFVAGVWS